jgi:hypothetical protein
MPPKCKVRKTWPAIGPKGCKAKAEAAPAAKAAPAHAPIVRDTPLIRLQRNATRNIQLIREEMQALNINKRVSKALTKTNAAATRAKIIRRIKGARGRKHMAVH